MADHGFWNYAQRDPGKLALAAPDGREWTRGELLAASNRLVHGLRALGLEKGDCIAVVLPNCAEYYAINLACAQAGWYLVPINWHLAAPEIAYIVEDSEAKILIAHERMAEVSRKAADDIGFAENGRFAIGEIPGFRPFAKISEGQPESIPGERTAGSVMNYTRARPASPRACDGRSRRSTPTRSAASSPASWACSASSPRTTTCTLWARRFTTRPFSCGARLP